MKDYYNYTFVILSNTNNYHLERFYIIINILIIITIFIKNSKEKRKHTESTFSSETRQSMKHRIIAKHLTEPK